MLPADERCKAPASDAISLPERTHDELALFLAFLYTGTLEDDGGGGGGLQVLEEWQLHELDIICCSPFSPWLETGRLGRPLLVGSWRLIGSANQFM
jgi:hypothetical protein